MNNLFGDLVEGLFGKNNDYDDEEDGDSEDDYDEDEHSLSKDREFRNFSSEETMFKSEPTNMLSLMMGKLGLSEDSFMGHKKDSFTPFKSSSDRDPINSIFGGIFDSDQFGGTGKEYLNFSKDEESKEDYMSKLMELLVKHEGYSPTMYKDFRHNPTIGVGHMMQMAKKDQNGKRYYVTNPGSKENFEKIGADWDECRYNGGELSKTQIYELLELDIERVVGASHKMMPHLSKLRGAVRLAMDDMAFNLGPNKFKTFVLLHENLKKLIDGTGTKEDVIKEMKNSDWYRSQGNRPKTLIKMIEEDEETYK